MNALIRKLICLGLFLCAPLPAQDVEFSHQVELLRYRTDDGAIRPVATVDDWQRRREDIRHNMQQVMGEMKPLPKAAPNHQVLESVDCGSYVRQLIVYETDADTWTPAYLCLPKQTIANGVLALAVLCLHPTDHQFGHQVVVGIGERAGRPYAAELAERGYVTLSPAYPLLADYWPNLPRLNYESGTMKAIWDNRRGLDLLGSLPHVDATRGFAAIGHSLGGHNAIFTAVFDERIRVVVSSCGFDSFVNYYSGDERNWYYGRGWCQARYMPRLSDYRGQLDRIPFDFPELLAALAPRTVLAIAPLHDDNFQWQSVQRSVDAARDVFKLFAAEEQLKVEHPDCAHDFPTAERETAYQLIDSVLRGQ